MLNKSDKSIENINNTFLPNILVAEDEDSVFMLFEIVLAKFAGKIVRAINGQQAIDIMSIDNNYDVILMDEKMPLMAGIEAITEIRKTNSDIAIIMQTAFVDNETRERAMSAGANAFITKPIDYDELKVIIRRLLL